MSTINERIEKYCSYFEERPHDALGDMTPVEYMENNAENSTFKLST
jgi:hypothetical protein